MEQVILKPWGNSQGIRIPKNILEKLNINISDTLQLDIAGDAIVLKKVWLEEYGGKISICEFDWGEPTGKEIL